MPVKLDISKKSTYRFYALLVGITYVGYNTYHINFALIFGFAFFIGMMVEEGFNMIQVYDRPVTQNTVTAMIIWSAMCAFIAAALVWVMVGMFGFDGKFATITSVVFVKFIQPLGSRIFILGV